MLLVAVFPSILLHTMWWHAACAAQSFAVFSVDATAGTNMFGHFALSHTFMPVIDETDDRSWVRYAMEHSVDISPGNPLVDWIMVRHPGDLQACTVCASFELMIPQRPQD